MSIRLAIVASIRVLTTTFTRLPGPALHCRAGPDYHVDVPETALDVVEHVGCIAGLVKSCGDLVYSGHTAIYVAVMLVMCQALATGRSPTAKKIVWASGITLVATFCVLVVAARRHYTVDCVVAVIVAVLLGGRFDLVLPSQRKLARALAAQQDAGHTKHE